MALSLKMDSDSMSQSSFGRLMNRESTKASTEAQEAELVAKATSQAMIAAKSIILSGGTQATALSTAKAAAQSIMIPKICSQNVVSNSNFMRRRKLRRQASIIASMALGSVNNSLQQEFSTSNRSRSMNDQTVRNDWAGTPMLLQGHFSSFVQNESYQNRETPSSMVLSRADVASPIYEPSPSPQASAMTTTESESQATNILSPLTHDPNKIKDPSFNPVTRNENSNTTPTNDGQHVLKEKKVMMFEAHPAVANILSGLASISDMGSANSHSRSPSMSRTLKDKESVDSPSRPPKIPQNAQNECRGKAKDYTDRFLRETTEYTIGLESKPKVHRISRRMEQFIHTSYSKDDSYTSEDGSANFSHDSTVSQSVGSVTIDTGTVDSGTMGYDTFASITYDDINVVSRENDGESVFGIGASTVLSSLAENFFCSPYPRIPKKTTKTIRENRQECQRPRERSPAHEAMGSSSSRSEEVEAGTIDSDSLAHDLEDTTDDDDVGSTGSEHEEAVEEKKPSIQETMEQLVLRALTAMPAEKPPLSPSTNTSFPSTFDSSRNQTFSYRNERSISIEGRGSSFTETESVGTGIDSIGNSMTRRSKLASLWSRTKKLGKFGKDTE